MNALAILDDLCRLCLSKAGVENIFHPLDRTNDIFNITGVKVLKSDALPQTICKNCLNIVNDALNLRTIAQKSDSQLSFLINGSTKYEEEEEKHLVAVSDNTVTPSSSKVDSKLQIDEVSEVESDVTVESLLKRKKKKHSKSESDRNGAFKCSKCDKSYSTRKKLSLHTRTHNRSFICPLDVCCKTFACKNDLKKHIRSHTGEKPFKCTMCEKSFTQNVTLKNHRMSVHCVDII